MTDDDFQLIDKDDEIDLIFLGHGDKVTDRDRDDDKKYMIGDHIVSPRFGGVYTHHGVYIGNNKVVHCTGEIKEGLPACSGGSKKAYIQIDDISRFKYGSNCYILNRVEVDNPKLFFERIRQNLGETDYSIVNNNCEHFANKITIGEPKSLQVRNTGGYIMSTLTGAGSGTFIKSFTVIPYIGHPIILGGMLGTFFYGIFSWFTNMYKKV